MRPNRAEVVEDAFEAAYIAGGAVESARPHRCGNCRDVLLNDLVHTKT